jgi:hypothetical protein
VTLYVLPATTTTAFLIIDAPPPPPPPEPEEACPPPPPPPPPAIVIKTREMPLGAVQVVVVVNNFVFNEEDQVPSPLKNVPEVPPVKSRLVAKTFLLSLPSWS